MGLFPTLRDAPGGRVASRGGFQGFPNEPPPEQMARAASAALLQGVAAELRGCAEGKMGSVCHFLGGPQKFVVVL